MSRVEELGNLRLGCMSDYISVSETALVGINAVDINRGGFPVIEVE